jgi:hypothetical protein
MPNKTLYIRDDAVKVWEAAEKRASKSGVSLSALITELLETYNSKQAEREKFMKSEFERIEFEAEDKHGTIRKKAFTGRWVIDPSDEFETEYSNHNGMNYQAGFQYAAAVTQKGQILIATAKRGEPHFDSFNVYASVEEAEQGNVPPDVLSPVAAELGDEEYVEELNI